MYSSIPFLMCDTVCLTRQVDSGDGDDGFIGIPPPLSALTGEHPINAGAGVGFPRPPSARQSTPAPEKSPRFFRQCLQGVTHYTLLCKVVCQTFPLDSLWQGCALHYPPLSASDNGATVTASSAFGGIPKLPSPLSTLSPLERTIRLPALIRR